MEFEEKNVKMLEEKLDIYKVWTRENDVHIYKKTVTENETVTVPIKKEYIIIEKTGCEAKEAEKIHIPVMEEQFLIQVLPIQLEEIEVFKQQFQELEHIDEALKHEEVRVIRHDAK